MKYVVFRDRYGRDFELHDLDSSPVDLHFSTWSESDAFQVLKHMAGDGNIGFLQECSRLLFRDDGQTAARDPAWVIELLGLYMGVGRFTLYQMLPKPSYFSLKDITTLELVPEEEQPEQLKGYGKKVYWASKEDKKMPNETDSKRCPSSNFRSESTATARPNVNEWLDQQGVAQGRRDGILGYDDGGGFLCEQTRTGVLKKGSVIWRYVDEGGNPVGAWWFEHPLEGDPRVFAALPPGSKGTFLVKGKAKENIPILYGPGAPRCSNKPGGPVQIFMAAPLRYDDKNNKDKYFPENDFVILEDA
jgi:hypothetical protein